MQYSHVNSENQLRAGHINIFIRSFHYITYYNYLHYIIKIKMIKWNEVIFIISRLVTFSWQIIFCSVLFNVYLVFLFIELMNALEMKDEMRKVLCFFQFTTLTKNNVEYRYKKKHEDIFTYYTKFVLW